ncbi:MAG: 50S ribosomal protein L29 [Malacoplasma sp.]|nr:50S ribosomal protein L29 [Malacoplasma sp.]
MIKDLRTKSDVELGNLISRLKIQLLELRFKIANGEVEDINKLKEIRKTIAMAMTVLSERDVKISFSSFNTQLYKNKNGKLELTALPTFEKKDSKLDITKAASKRDDNKKTNVVKEAKKADMQKTAKDNKPKEDKKTVLTKADNKNKSANAKQNSKPITKKPTNKANNKKGTK